jgi:hypothetical protein
MSDQFEGWTQLLALAQQHKTKSAMREAILASGLKIIENEPLSGYYRCAAVKDGPLLPVAIWRDGGQLCVLRSGEAVALERVWPYCVWNPISYDWYELVMEQGGTWPDAAPEATVQALPAEVSREVIGGNNPPDDEDEAASIKNKIEQAKGVAETLYANIATQEEADAAQAMRSRLLALSGEADKKRETEKRPHFEKAKAVDTKWQPIVKMGKDTADWIRGKLSEFVTAQARKEAEQRRIEEVRLAEEQAREEAERAAADPQWDAGEQPGPERIVEPEPPAPAAPTATTIKGATGRAATIRVIKLAKVVDYDKAYAHLKAIPEIKQAIDKVAQRMITAGHDVPGVEVDERRDVA